MKPCDICLEKECKAKGGIGTCNCETCAINETCPRKLRATIRITLKCTQACNHCCFECSPEKETHMSVEIAEKIARFLKNNEVFSVNLMGGEIFCNPDWREILDLIIPAVTYARIVSNGDWVEHEKEFAEYLTKFDNCYVCISKDQWHSNKNIEEAEQLLINNNIIHKTSDLDETESGLVPIGRAQYSGGLYSMMVCYCHNPQKEYSFLIDETGNVYKCNFGVWDYAHIDDYINGGFAARFKEFNKIFYSQFISNCSRCIRAYKYNL